MKATGKKRLNGKTTAVKHREGKPLIEVFAEERPGDLTLTISEIDFGVEDREAVLRQERDDARQMVQTLDRESDVCPMCCRWNARTRGHRTGCRLGSFLNGLTI